MSVRVLSLAFAAGLAAVTPAAAQDREPDWLKKPTAEDLYSVWPTAAWERGEGGRALISCTVTLQGALRNCRVVSETPAGSGFGAAALTLASQFLMKPAIKGGQPVVSDVQIPIAFESPGKALGSRLRGPDAITRRVIRSVRWLESPSLADVQAAVPAKARAEKVTGHVTLDCGFTREARLSACNTLLEEPKGYQFAGAAKQLTSRFRGPARDAAGASLDGVRIQLPFTFAPELLDTAAPLIGRPDWIALPTADDLRAALPEAAKKAGVLKARVTLACTVAADGGLQGCSPAVEDPPGYGYGAATVQLARTFRLSIWSAEGLPTVGGQVRVPIRYDFTDDPPASK